MAVSAEAVLISALINTGSVGTESQFGVTPADFDGYQDEYNWVINYVATYHCQPSQSIFQNKWPGFPLVDHTNVRSAADAVFQAADRRRMTTMVTEYVDMLHVGELDAAHELARSVQPRHAHSPLRNVLSDVGHLDSWDQRPYCIELPYPTLQRHTGGIRKGGLWLIAARPGQGKSAHLVSIARQAVLDGNGVRFFSLEMSEEEVRARFHVCLAQDMGYPTITLTNLRQHAVDRALYRRFHGELAERLSECGGRLDLHTPADGRVTPGAVGAHANDYDMTIIDYVGLMGQDDGSAAVDDWRNMARISNSLKTIALSSDTAILGAAQINRDGETGQNPPKIKNLSQSDALGQDADVVLTLRAKPHNVATHFSLEKNRHGPSGTHFWTTFGVDRGTFTEISSDHAEDLVINAEMLVETPSIPAPKLRVIKKDEL